MCKGTGSCLLLRKQQVSQSAGAWGQDRGSGRWANITQRLRPIWELATEPGCCTSTREPLQVLKVKERHAQRLQFPHMTFPRDPTRSSKGHGSLENRPLGTLPWNGNTVSPRAKRLCPQTPLQLSAPQDSQHGWRSWRHARTPWAGTSCGQGLGGS